MKKIILFALLAIVVVPTFVMAQDCPTPPASATASVTFKRINPGPTLDGIFTIDGNGNTVQFSKGNLQYQATTNTWQFAAHQYDMIGAANEYISESNTGWIDLFGWATAGNSASGFHYQPWDSSTENSYGSSQTNHANWNVSDADWAINFETAWRTLTEAEWDVLLLYRSTSAIVNDTANARWTFAKILTDGIGTAGVDKDICGLILFPDDFDGTNTPIGVSWSEINTFHWNLEAQSTCTTEGWAELEEAGCVFLPCSGYLVGTTITNIGIEGFYWSATSGDGTQAETLHFPNWNFVYTFERHRGHAVRLVHVVSE